MENKIKISYLILFLFFFLSSCAATKTVYKQNKVEKKSTDISQMSDYDLCYVALNGFSLSYGLQTLMWHPEAKRNSPHVREAKSRGLTCGVNTNKKRISTRKINSWTDKELCNFNKLHYSNPKKYSKPNRYILDIVQTEQSRRNLDCNLSNKNIITAVNTSNIRNNSIASKELKKEREARIALQSKANQEEKKRIELEKKLAALQSEKKKQIKKAKKNEIGSGFYVSKFRHIVTNQHVVNQCKKITVGDSITKQIPATLVASDKRNDLAILQTISMEMASADTKSFLQNLSIEIVPVLSGGLMRSEDVKGGEEIIVAGYPLGNMVSDTIKVTKGIVSATRGMDNNFSQFEIDAVIRKGNSGGPIYDKRGNIVGVAVSRLSVNRTDTINFGIKGSTVKQFLSANDVPTTWANRAQRIDTQELYKIASKQTVMVVCHR